MISQVVEALEHFKEELREHKWFPSPGESPSWWAGYSDQFHIAVTAVLVRMNRWEQAERAMRELAKRGLDSPEAIARAPEGELEEAIRGVVFRRAKARHLKILAEAFLAQGSLREKIMLAPIGRETREAILLFALNEPLFPLSRQAKRVLSRYGIRLGRREAREIEEALGRDLYKLKLLHASLTVIARLYCKPRRTRCEGCPLSPTCSKIL
ncbi:MAG: endonuclease III domain-containing protein [Acidilobaceae archaeon]